MKKVLISACITSLMLSGCSMLGKIAEMGAETNDEAVRSSKFVICKGASIGAILREFDTKEEAAGWIQLCLGEDKKPEIITGVIEND